MKTNILRPVLAAFMMAAVALGGVAQQNAQEAQKAQAKRQRQQQQQQQTQSSSSRQSASRQNTSSSSNSTRSYGWVESETNSYSHGSWVSNYRRAHCDVSQDNTLQNFAATVGTNGPLKITLIWEGSKDFDLGINAPNSEDITYNSDSAHPGNSRHTGDSMGGSGRNYESITFQDPESGLYDIFVRSVSSLPSNGYPINVVVKSNNSVVTYKVNIPEGNWTYYLIDRFDYTNPNGGGGGSSNWGTASSSTSSYSSGSWITSYHDTNPWVGQDTDAQYRASNLGGSGPLKITLMWDASNDLDLGVNTATGEDIYFGNRSGAHGASHSGDQMGGNGSYESVSFSNPATGIYDVFVRVRGTVNSPIPVKVVIKEGNSVKTYRVKLPTGGGEDYRIANFRYTGSGSSSSSNSIPYSYASASTSNCSYSNTVGDYVTANVSEDHNSALEQRGRNLSGNARLRITAFWDFSGDIDLIVNTPGRHDVYFGRSSDSETGGNFSGDQFGGTNSFESVRFTNPASGLYDIFIRCRSSVPSGGKVTVVVNDGTTSKTYTTRIEMNGASTRDFKFPGYVYSR